MSMILLANMLKKSYLRLAMTASRFLMANPSENCYKKQKVKNILKEMKMKILKVNRLAAKSYMLECLGIFPKQHSQHMVPSL